MHAPRCIVRAHVYVEWTHLSVYIHVYGRVSSMYVHMGAACSVACPNHTQNTRWGVL